MPTLPGIWHLKWGREVATLLVIVIVVIGGHLFFNEDSFLFKDSSWWEILFGVNFVGFGLVLFVIDKGEPLTTD